MSLWHVLRRTPSAKLLPVLPISRRTFLSSAALAAAGCIAKPTTPATQPLEASSDRRADLSFVDHGIQDISDEDLFAALDLNKPELKSVRSAVSRKDYPAAYRAWGEYWKIVAPGRARFIGDGDLLMSRDEATKSLETRRAQILADAEPVLAHNINGWGTVTIQHGPIVDFDADYGKNGQYGFHYWGWSRRLINAFLITSDEKYLGAFDELFNQWYAQRNQIHGQIKGLDVVYNELGLGLRCRPFLEFYALASSAKPQAATHEHMLKTILGAGRWLYEEEKRQYRNGNWQIMGSYGLAWIGAMLTEFSDASKWVQMGADRIAKHVEADFFPDGCHSERVPSSYMLVAYRDPRNLAALLQDRQEYVEISGRIREPLKRTLEWYFAMLPPDGFIPAINDGSRAVMPRALVEDANNLFGMNMPAEAHAPIRAESVSLPASGFTAMRSDATPDALYMLINHGPSGGGHSHADSLDFQMHAYGQACAIDSGIGVTYDDPNQKPWYVRTRAHNALMVDGDDLNRTQAEGRDVVWTTLKTLDYFAATHFGYLQSKDITHRRHFIFVKPMYWLIYDLIEARHAPRGKMLSWNLHSPTPMEEHQSGFSSKSGPGVIVLPSASWARQQSKGPASVRGIRGHEGKDYADIDWISFESAVDPAAPQTLGVLLFPFADARPDVAFSIVATDHRASHFMVKHPAGVDHILIGEEGCTLKSMDFTFSGACAVVRCRDDKPVSFATAKTLSLKLGERSLVDSPRMTDVEGNF